jgi:3-oxoacyl-(acyl-carrier-protein) synthase
MGCVTPFGYGVEKAWGALRQAWSALAPISRFDTSAYCTRIAAEVDEDHDLDSASRLNLKLVSRNSRLSLAAVADLAHEQGWDTMSPAALSPKTATASSWAKVLPCCCWSLSPAQSSVAPESMPSF